MSSFLAFWNSENMTEQAHPKILECFIETTVCGDDDLFFALHLILRGKLDICGSDYLQSTCPTFAGSENMATLGRDKPKTPERCHKEEVFKFAPQTLER